ncbi:MAG: alpha/beta hydrolase, partial [Candidatus Thorarchaeota archaeon]
EHDTQNPLISPLYADLQDFPPLFIQVGTSEMILDDSLRIAKKAEEAGVEVTLDVWESMPHVFSIFFQYAPESRKAIERVCEYLSRHLS